MLDLTDYFDDAIKAEGTGRNVMILRHIPKIKRLDGKMASYEVEYRWLSEPLEQSIENLFGSVQGNEFELYQKKELIANDIDPDGPNKNIHLFEKL